MKKFFILLSAFLLAISIAGNASAIPVDPDASILGTDISNFFSGVTLSSVGAGFDADYDAAVYAIDPTLYMEPYNASTGSLVFGTNDGTWPHLFGGWGDASLRIDFSTSVSSVALDGISNNHTDIAMLQAYDYSNTLIDTYTTAAMNMGVNPFETMSVAGNISYVIASGVGGDSVGFDNLNYDAQQPVPEPATLLLLGTGLFGLAARRRFSRKG